VTAVDPWEREEGESEAAFVAFAAYRDEPPPRSIARAAQRLGKARQLLEGWSAKNGWVRRVSAYDRHLDTVRRQARLEEIEEMVRRQAADLATAAATLATPVRRCLERIQSMEADGDDPFAEMPLADLVQLSIASTRAMNSVIACERVIAGLEDERGESALTMDPEVIAHMRARDLVAGMTRQELESVLLGRT